VVPAQAACGCMWRHRRVSQSPCSARPHGSLRKEPGLKAGGMAGSRCDCVHPARPRVRCSPQTCSWQEHGSSSRNNSQEVEVEKRAEAAVGEGSGHTAPAPAPTQAGGREVGEQAAGEAGARHDLEQGSKRQTQL
jgi:hypothetical protein